jgi:hypothetical protein
MYLRRKCRSTGDLSASVARTLRYDRRRPSPLGGVLACLKDSVNSLHDLLARDAHILACTEQVVTLGFANEGARRQLDHPGTMAALKRQLKLMAKRPLAVERVLLSVAAIGYTGEDHE